jgi:hypothetical protein
MTIISINIPDAITPRVINAFARKYGYRQTLEDGTANPITKAQFAKAKLIEFIKQSVKDMEVDDARNTAATAAVNAADTEITIT